MDRAVTKSASRLISEDDSEGLFVVIGLRSAFWAILPEMNDPEPDLRFRLAVGRVGHPGSQMFLFANR